MSLLFFLFLELCQKSVGNFFFKQIYWSACLIFVLRRSLPKICGHEEEGVHQNPQYTGQHHFHPVPHDHDFCERVVINVIMNKTNYNPDHQHKLKYTYGDKDLTPTEYLHLINWADSKTGLKLISLIINIDLSIPFLITQRSSLFL